MRAGKFISFEGGEGCGKSTQARLLADWLEEQGRPVLLTREPGGTAGAEAIRELLLHPSHGSWTAPAEAMLFAAARADHVAKVIKPALESGTWVICDRFVDSSIAYQGVAGGVGSETVRQLHQIGSGGLLPDRTILLEVDHAIAAERMAARNQPEADVIEQRGEAYHQSVAAAFQSLAEDESNRFLIIDGSGAVAEVQSLIRASLKPLIQPTAS